MDVVLQGIERLSTEKFHKRITHVYVLRVCVGGLQLSNKSFYCSTYQTGCIRVPPDPVLPLSLIPIYLSHSSVFTSRKARLQTRYST